MTGLLDLLFPPRCLLCGELLDGEKFLCGSCRKSAPWCHKVKTKSQFLDSITAVWYYKENVRSSLLRFKFGSQPQLAAGYGRFLGAQIRRTCPGPFDYLTWVPTASRRKFHRGYDQAELLCRAVGKELHMKPVRLLKKVRNNPAQSGLSDPAARRANVMGVYRPAGSRMLAGKRILLIDDILTTGATAGECARVLRAQGASQVHCGAVAVSDRS